MTYETFCYNQLFCKELRSVDLENKFYFGRIDLSGLVMCNAVNDHRDGISLSFEL